MLVCPSGNKRTRSIEMLALNGTVTRNLQLPIAYELTLVRS